MTHEMYYIENELVLDRKYVLIRIMIPLTELSDLLVRAAPCIHFP